MSKCARPITDSPTEHQLEILAFLNEYDEAHGWAPTLREIGTAFGIRSTNGVNDHLRALERRQLLHRAPKLSRAMRVTEHGFHVLWHGGYLKSPPKAKP